MIFLISIYYTFKFRLMQFRCFKNIKKDLINKKSKSAYLTFLVSLGSHIGTGNIVGVSTALILGGSGTIVWMWVFTMFGSVFSYIENVLSLKSREKIDGEYRSGTSYYMYKFLGQKPMAIVFAVLLILTNTILFQEIQVNTISESLKFGLKINNNSALIIILFFTIFFIFKGTKVIVKVEEILVPVMLIGFLGISCYAIVYNINVLPKIIKDMFINATNFKEVGMGLFISMVTLGMKRSLFSNEAGLGTIPSISGMSDVEKAQVQAKIQVFGVFVDMFFCTLTALMILIYNINLEGLFGCDAIISLFIGMFGQVGKWFGIFFLLSFSLATLVSQFYLGESNMIFITDKMKIGNKSLFKMIYKGLFIIGIFCGVYLNTLKIFEIIDITLVVLGVINIITLMKILKKNQNVLD